MMSYGTIGKRMSHESESIGVMGFRHVSVMSQVRKRKGETCPNRNRKGLHTMSHVKGGMCCCLDKRFVGCAALVLYDSIGKGVEHGDECCVAVHHDLLNHEAVTCSRRHQRSVSVLSTKEGGQRCNNGERVDL